MNDAPERFQVQRVVLFLHSHGTAGADKDNRGTFRDRHPVPAARVIPLHFRISLRKIFHDLNGCFRLIQFKGTARHEIQICHEFFLPLSST